MPKKSDRRSKNGKEKEVHTHLAIRVRNYAVQVSGSINHEIYHHIGLWDNGDDLVYEFGIRIEIAGVSIYPKERADDTYEITIHGDDARSRGYGATLKDMHARDAHGSLRYRRYRGKEVPIYDQPRSLGLLNKARGESRWVGWLFTPSRFARDMLVLLSHGRDLFVALHERRIGRTRWIHGISLQTNDPTEE